MHHYHLARIIHEKAEQYKERTAIRYKDSTTDIWTSISWNEFSKNILNTAKALAAAGVAEQENIGFFSQNLPQYLIADYAIYANRAVGIPIYATSTTEQVDYIVHDAEIRFIFVGEQYQYEQAFAVQRTSQVLKQIIVFDKSVKFLPEDFTSVYYEDFVQKAKENILYAEKLVARRMLDACEDDMASIMYTSGTTGTPKGVILKHSNYVEAIRIHDIRLVKASDKDVSLCFLPLTHIFEKAWTYFALHKGMTVALNHDPKKIQQAVKDVRPTIMCSVPRFWEKVYSGVHDKVETFSSFKKKLFKKALKTGKKYLIDYKNNDIKAPVALALKFAFYNKFIFSKLKKELGIENGNFFPCSGASLSDTVTEFLMSVNIPIVYGYGLTETTATVSCYPVTGYKIGTVGIQMPDVEVKLGEDGEILVKGKTVMHGYYKKPEETAKVFTEDGFLKTGDAGFLAVNVLSMKERIKELYKTSNGKYVAPQVVESKMAGDKYIDQVAVIGDQRKFVSALIVPIYEALEAYAKENGIHYNNREELLNTKMILEMMEKRIEKLQKQLPSFERIKQFTLLPEPFTIENGILTNTLKLKRAIVLERYKFEIERMYHHH